jgi:uroporphyrinogen-III synthase
MLQKKLVVLFFILAFQCISAQNNEVALVNLQQRTIVVPTPEHYAGRFIRIIEEANGIAIKLPTIETVFNPCTAKMDHVLKNPGKYDWVALPSRKAIQSFFRRVKVLSITSSQLDSLQFCAIGKDMEYLEEEYTRKVSLQPAEPSPDGIIRSLAEKSDLEGKTIAVIIPRVEKLTEPDVIPNFISDLKALGLHIVKIEGYISRPVDAPMYEEKLQLIKNRQVDAIAFTSMAEVEAMIQMPGGIEWLNKNTIACFGPYTAANARKAGVKVDYAGSDFHSFERYVQGLAKYLNQLEQE